MGLRRRKRARDKGTGGNGIANAQAAVREAEKATHAARHEVARQAEAAATETREVRIPLLRRLEENGFASIVVDDILKGRRGHAPGSG